MLNYRLDFFSEPDLLCHIFYKNGSNHEAVYGDNRLSAKQTELFCDDLKLLLHNEV